MLQLLQKVSRLYVHQRKFVSRHNSHNRCNSVLFVHFILFAKHQTAMQTTKDMKRQMKRSSSDKSAAGITTPSDVSDLCYKRQ